ncbi:hypothetical protein B0H67DRAFT_644825 [Lasiosphaeris hirsuta]|uniref:Uncharacterized protein n=1 Tax=Lasiosphaeris hirsuta TaxID=260670 RepID=A0AA40AFU2_9PEZI|nr:hypothetical protein B0H67DRAFT_644825 [Lasiosphaeris hirsuta]
MRFTTLQAVFGSASLFLSATSASIHGHRHAHEQYGKRHTILAEDLIDTPKSHVEKRSTCSLPDHPDLVYVPGAKNNGFAMAGDVACLDGKYCPIACVAGKVMAQWQPDSKYVYPQSMNGGLYCNNGVAEKPFPDAPYCVDGTGTVQAVNKCGKVVSFCQTVLPGDEAMVIPTDVMGTTTIAVPGISYWDKTAAHYYINPPGVSASKGCIWGVESEPIGNWSPYVAGANTVANGDTYVKIAWNPMFVGGALKKNKPSFGVKIECPGGGCNGLPCSIDPSSDGVGGVRSPVKATGVGDADFCVVTVPKGGTANIVVFNTDGSDGGPATTSVAPPPTTTTKPKPPPTTSSSSSSSFSNTVVPTTSSAAFSWSSSAAVPSSSSSSTAGPFQGGVFHENSTQTDGSHSSSHGTITVPTLGPSPDAAAPVSATSKNEGAADQSGTAIAGLIVALVAAAALY